jgi:hypothetical protein
VTVNAVAATAVVAVVASEKSLFVDMANREKLTGKIF